MRALYAFSKRLAGTHDAADIYAAIQDDVSLITRRPVVYFEAGEASLGPRHRSNAPSPTRIGQIRPLEQFVENQKHGHVGDRLRALSARHPRDGSAIGVRPCPTTSPANGLAMLRGAT